MKKTGRWISSGKMLRMGAGLVLLISAGGCAAGKLLGGVMQNDEYQKLVEKPAMYTGLESKRVAVFVNADMATLYENPDLTAQIAAGVSARIKKNVPTAQVIDPRLVVDWQYRTPGWEAMSYGELTEKLNVDRIVMVDIYEFRLNPPGNRYLWDAVCAATVGVVERDSVDPDQFAATYDVQSEFPSHVKELTRDEAAEDTIRSAVLYDFVQRTTWLFHTHTEPKYPDKYRPELDKKT